MSGWLLSSAAKESRTDDPAPTPKPKSTKKKDYSDTSDDGLESLGVNAVGGLFVLSLYATANAVIPERRTIIYTHNNGEEESITLLGHSEYFSDFPYQHDFGYMLMGDEWYGIGKYKSVRASVEYASDFSHLSRIGTKVLVEGNRRWGLDTQWDEYFESIPGGGTDQLTLGDINVTLRYFQGYHGQLRFGLGANILADTNGSEAGINFTGSYDAYLGKPWIWSSEFDLGKVGSADLFRFRTTVGVNWKHIEAYTGYQYTNIEGAELNGFVSGLRVWF
ncbi:hypothetical protein C5Y97_09675 [Blastopirellula marina]|uniref:Uncharacterized protein n=2 Tax=Blastopirellula marina TaxID=124 RepID=A0A2S8G1L1_9BACT|nr:hypothetical protein C5Y98_09670 [Blastopirellula marina]PTL44982.1 hypothetical protein C5Y97_09675 [Blastopirellula marina]